MNKRRYFDSDPETDHDLKNKLTSPEELSGILNWALEGLLRLLARARKTIRGIHVFL